MDDSFSSDTATITIIVLVVVAALLMAVAVDQNIKKNTTTKYFEGMVSSSFNIQYQSTGVGSLSSLDETELK